jgi:indolepyruvate ferredoxin oxidoreductase
MMILGAAWQKGLIPLSEDAILRAIELNRTAVEGNKAAFNYGRWAVLFPDDAGQVIEPSSVVEKPKSLDEQVAVRTAQLTEYQSERLARKYCRLIDRFEDQNLREIAAKSYHKLLSYKDEYEVARLLLSTEDKARAEFDGELKLTYHLSPPLFAGIGPDGRPKKRSFGPWILRAYRMLEKMKVLRGTPFDVFGFTSERRTERRLIKQFEADAELVLLETTPERIDAAVALLSWPLQVRGFGPVKNANAKTALANRKDLRAAFKAAPASMAQAAE